MSSSCKPCRTPRPKVALRMPPPESAMPNMSRMSNPFLWTSLQYGLPGVTSGISSFVRSSPCPLRFLRCPSMARVSRSKTARRGKGKASGCEGLWPATIGAGAATLAQAMICDAMALPRRRNTPSPRHRRFQLRSGEGRRYGPGPYAVGYLRCVDVPLGCGSRGAPNIGQIRVIATKSRGKSLEPAD